MNNFILTALGFLLSALIDIGSRNRRSKRTPEKFSFEFFAKDNIGRFVVSGLTSVCLVGIYHFASFGFESQEYEDLFAIAVGFAPDLVIGWLKRKFGFLKHKI